MANTFRECPIFRVRGTPLLSKPSFVKVCSFEGGKRWKAAFTPSNSTFARFNGSTIMCNVSKKDAGSLMVVSDLDFTMVDHKDQSHSSLLSFGSLWQAEYTGNSHLVYSTGRSPEKYLELRKQVPLITPDTVILSVGTEIRYGPAMEADDGWEAFLNEGWNREIIVEEAKKIPTLQFQEESEQRPHKVSFKVDKKDAEDIIRCLSTKFKEHKLDVKLIYSGGIDLDVLPQRAGKGEALSYVLKKAKSEGWATERVLVCGDSGNDIELFTVKGVNGVMVENAQEELVKWYNSQASKEHIHFASRRCAGGIIEAMKVFNMGPSSSPRDPATHDSSPSPSAQREVVELNIFIEKWLKGEISDNDDTFNRYTCVIGEGATVVSGSGVEESMMKSAMELRSNHSLMEGKQFKTWVDCVKEMSLSEGVYVLTWHSWEQSSSSDRKGYFATGILQAKDGTSNGVEWLRIHETVRKM